MTVTLSGTTPPALGSARLPGLDSLRGAAVVLMVIDHACLLFAGPAGEVYRLTAGRVAMPLFFLIAGSLARRFTTRHAGVALLGLALPLVVPWLDAPNVLTVYAAGVLLLQLLHRVRYGLLLVLLGALTLLANGWGFSPGNGYDIAALWALMVVGRHLGPLALHSFGAKIPHTFLGAVGRRPLSWYVGHVLLLSGVATVLAS